MWLNLVKLHLDLLQQRHSGVVSWLGTFPSAAHFLQSDACLRVQLRQVANPSQALQHNTFLFPLLRSYFLKSSVVSTLD
jgi:hypothetical protein